MKGFEESKGPSDLTCSHTAHAQKGWRGATGEFPCSRSARPRKALAGRPQKESPGRPA